jgi:glycogen synthase
VPHQEVQKYYSLVDLFVYPRLAMRLTDLVTPLKPLEAMAQGKLVVASNVGGHQELIRDGFNGYLFQANEVSSLVETLLRAHRDMADWIQILRNARHFVEQQRTWSKSIRAYVPVYEKLVGDLGLS